MELEQVIGKGANNVVYKSGNKAVKVFNAGYSKADVLNEAYIAARIEDIGGINIPKIYELPEINNKLSIVTDLIEGKTMAELIRENPKKKEEYLEKLVDIQMDLHSKRCSYLRKLKDKLTLRINSAEIDDNKKYELLSILAGAPKHNKICHGDITPHNIIIDKKGISFVIDWNHATQGNASADVARTYLWLCLHMEDAADNYLEIFCKKSNTDKRYVQKWLPVVAAARLSKNKEDEEELLRKWIDVVEYE